MTTLNLKIYKGLQVWIFREEGIVTGFYGKIFKTNERRL